MSGEARFWEEADGGKVRCLVCPHECVIAEGREGLCRVRGMRAGRLECLVYGRPATVVSDEIEKKPLYHFHPGTRALSLGTLGCNVLCLGMPELADLTRGRRTGRRGQALRSLARRCRTDGPHTQAERRGVHLQRPGGVDRVRARRLRRLSCGRPLHGACHGRIPVLGCVWTTSRRTRMRSSST